MSVLRILAVCVFAAVVLVARTEDVGAAEIASLRLGHQGQGKVGRWLPVSAMATELTVGQRVELQAAFPDPRGDICVETVAAAIVTDSGTVDLHGYFRTGRIEGTGVVSVVDAESGMAVLRSSVSFGENVEISDAKTSVQRRLLLRKLDALTLMVVGGGESGIEGIEELFRNAATYSRDQSILQGIQLKDTSKLPDNVDGLDAVDVLLIADDFQTSPAQATAVRQWVLDGGHLIVSTGGTVAEFLKSNIGAWVAAHFGIEETPIPMRRFNTMEAFVTGASRIQTNLNRKDSWPVARMTGRQVTALVDSLDGPIVGTQGIGTGIVTVVGVDLNQLPFNRWTSLPQFLEVLIFGEKLSPQSTDRRRTSRVSQSGVSDLATQLLAANDAVPQAGQWSTWSVMAMLVAWLILIGPLDFLLVTKLLKRPHLTWFSFPLLIIAGAAIVFWAAGVTGELQLRQLHVLDVMPDDDAQQVNVRSWMSVSAPETMRAAFRAEPKMDIPGLTLAANDGSADQPQNAALQLSWSGRPEDVFGAMYRKGGVGLGQQRFQHSRLAADRVTNLPLLTNGSRSFEARWHGTSQKPLITSQLSVSGFGLLRGTFSHHLPESITDWIVVHGNRVYRADAFVDDFVTLTSDVEWTAQCDAVYASDLKAYLIGARLVQEEDRQGTGRGSTQVQTPYDATSADPSYILAMLSFYDYAGGAEYVGLSHTQLRRMEVTDTARLNHAVLIGRIGLPVSSMSINDQQIANNESQTLVRLFIPVDKRPAATGAKTEEELKMDQQRESENQP